MANNQSQREMRFDSLLILLCWEGELRNGRLQRLLNLASVQVSRLIRHFRDEYPNLIISDVAEKRWVLTDRNWLPVIPSIEAYTRLLSENDPTSHKWMTDARPSFLSPDPAIFASVRSACVSGSGLKVYYRSMTSPEGQLRSLFPHSMIRLGKRWHVRAWCSDRQSYRDFNLGRMRAPVLTAISAKDERPDDHLWHTLVDLHIGAHRNLSPAHQILIREEYFGGNETHVMSARAPLVPYLIQDLQIAIKPAEETPPAFQLELLNVNDIDRFTFT